MFFVDNRRDRNFFNSVEDDVWEAEDEKQIPWLIELRVGIDCVCKYDQCIFPWLIMDKNNNNTKLDLIFFENRKV